MGRLSITDQFKVIEDMPVTFEREFSFSDAISIDTFYLDVVAFEARSLKNGKQGSSVFSLTDEGTTKVFDSFGITNQRIFSCLAEY